MWQYSGEKPGADYNENKRSLFDKKSQNKTETALKLKNPDNHKANWNKTINP